MRESPVAVRVRLVRLAPDAPHAPEDWLTAVERARLDAMTAPRRRRQFVAGHRLARELAAQATGTHFDSWELHADALGAPRLSSRDGAARPLHVSLAHGGEWVACALGATALGIDLEAAPRDRDLEALARHAFSARNAAQIVACEGEARKAAFYRCWTLAEAQGKHDGRGFHAQASRTRTFRECAPAQAAGRTWQAGEVTLALWTPPARGLDVAVEGWDAPAPCYWTAESVGAATGD